MNTEKITETKKSKIKIKLLVCIVITLFLLVIIANVVLQHIKDDFIAKALAYKTNPVTAEKVHLTSWHPVLTNYGFIYADKSITLVAQAPATVKKINFKSGDKVQEGDVILELDNSIEQDTLNANLAQLDALTESYNRAKILYKNRTISKSQYEEIESKYLAAKSSADGVKNSINRRNIIAPFDGYIGIIQVREGEFVQPGMNIVQVQNNDNLKVRFSIAQNQISKIRLGLKIQLETDSFPNKQFDGEITAIAPSVSKTSGLIEIEAKVKDQELLLKDGMYTKINVLLDQLQNKVVVPSIAVTYSIYGETAYILEKLSAKEQTEILSKFPEEKRNNIYRVKLVSVKSDDSVFNKTLISKGLKDGDSIVTSGFQSLQDNSLVEIINRKPVGIDMPGTIPNL